jgi:glycosyltransferase involved in cell wall biosynthesis
MFVNQRIAVVIPAYNEEKKIAATVASIPDFVDDVIVVDDASMDDTDGAARQQATRADNGARVLVVRHHINQGVGAAIVTGYRQALHSHCDIIAVMAGDGQMDPADLVAVLQPIVDKQADYVKGNRFRHPEIWKAMPATRIVGNVVLSAATKLTSGYHHVFDSQCGYTAITAAALTAIDLDGVFPRYGYPNDMLSRLHVARMRVVDVPVRPVYGPHWRSGINLSTAFHPIPWVLLRSWGNRIAAEARRSR